MFWGSLALLFKVFLNRPGSWLFKWSHYAPQANLFLPQSWLTLQVGDSCNKLLLLQPFPQNELHPIFFLMQGITWPPTSWHTCVAEHCNFHPKGDWCDDLRVEKKPQHCISLGDAPQLLTCGRPWHWEMTFPQKWGKLYLKSLCPRKDFGNTKEWRSSCLSWSLWCSVFISELTIGSLHVGLLYLLV